MNQTKVKLPDTIQFFTLAVPLRSVNKKNVKKHEWKKPYLEIELAKQIREAYSEVRRAHKLTMFQYSRIYDDGSMFILSDQLSAIEYIFEKEISMPSVLGDSSSEAGAKLWYLDEPGGPRSEGLRYYSEALKIESCFDFIKRENNYFELTCFGSSTPHEKAVNHFINHLDPLERFSADFLKLFEKVIHQANKDRIDIPYSMKPRSLLQTGVGKISPFPNLIASKIDSVLNSVKTVNLSKREKDCLKLLFLGNTAKEMATSMNISPRTAETYLERIKTKLGCYKKSKIIESLLKSG